MYKEVKALIKNTTFEARANEKGEATFYKISPSDGYKLHVKHLDEPVFDENGNDTGKMKKGYTKAFTTVTASYDFEENPNEIYAEPDTDPAPIAE